MWGQFKERNANINDPENYIEGSAGSMPPWSGWRNPELWEGEGWRDDLPDNWVPPEPIKAIALLKAEKLQLIDTWAAAAITGGFQSAATGKMHTYDSDGNDQFNLHAMYSATLTTDFETAAPYYGVIPIRAIPQGETEKVILQHNKEQMNRLFKDLAFHIGACKQKLWQLQQAVVIAETLEELDTIEWPK